MSFNALAKLSVSCTCNAMSSECVFLGADLRAAYVLLVTVQLCFLRVPGNWHVPASV